MSKDLTAIKHSALWAAYGDALGFITELTDREGLQWRVKAPRVTQTVPWRRMIGGTLGVEAALPAGCYSDDTQLRLATSRAIGGEGRFDVEAFAKVELPVWLGYSLGAGRGTKVAAASLRSPDVAWFSNFFDKSKVRYPDCGGNGSAMRIQPHVWSSPNRSKPENYLLDVLRNVVCTHGHLRGILGAVFHAVCLGITLEEKKVPGPNAWKEAVNYFAKLVPLMREDPNLGQIWLSVWEQRTKSSIEAGIEEVQKECLADIDLASRLASEGSASSYCRVVEALGGLTAEQKGSGTKTAIIAAVLSWIHREEYPATALVKAANLLNSDTDTIATMAGAIMGAVSAEPPRSPIQDEEYIVFEASRMASLSKNERTESFHYPDLFRWHAPKTQLDVLAQINGSFALSGLGRAEELGPPLQGRKKEEAIWQWFRLEFGQTVFLKRRAAPKPLLEGNLAVTQIMRGRETFPKTSFPNMAAKLSKSPEQQNLLDEVTASSRNGMSVLATIDQLTGEAIRSNFDERLIGEHLMSLASDSHGIERALAYVSIIIKARMARMRATENGSKS